MIHDFILNQLSEKQQQLSFCRRPVVFISLAAKKIYNVLIYSAVVEIYGIISPPNDLNHY